MNHLLVVLALLLLASPVAAQPIQPNNVKLTGTSGSVYPKIEATGPPATLGVNVITKGGACLQVNGVCVAGGGGGTCAVGSANTICMAGSSTGNPVTISATGSDSDISVALLPKGLGVLLLNTSTVIDGFSGYIRYTGENPLLTRAQQAVTFTVPQASYPAGAYGAFNAGFSAFTTANPNVSDPSYNIYAAGLFRTDAPASNDKYYGGELYGIWVGVDWSAVGGGGNPSLNAVVADIQINAEDAYSAYALFGATTWNADMTSDGGGLFVETVVQNGATVGTAQGIRLQRVEANDTATVQADRGITITAPAKAAGATIGSTRAIVIDATSVAVTTDSIGLDIGNVSGGGGVNAAIRTGTGAVLLGDSVTTAKHLQSSTTAPAVTNTSANSCGTSAASIVGTDVSGKVTVGSVGGTSCTVTFGAAWTNAPSCVVTNETTANLARATSTTGTVILAGTFVAGDVLAYLCLGRI